MHWAGDSQSLVSASQDGKLLLWNALTTNKLKTISLKSAFVMTVGMEPTSGRLVACGGLDNLCTVYKWSDGSTVAELAHHDGFVSSCRFLDENHILTASGDSTLCKWNVETGRVLDTFAEHSQDVMCMALSPDNPNMFCSGSVDKTVKVWDLRSSKAATHTFSGIHEDDVNGVDFGVNNTIGTASGDGNCQVLDLRAYGPVATLSAEKSDDGLTSVAFSKSGRILFAGHSNASVVAWDVLSAGSDPVFPAFVIQNAHDKRVSCIGINPKGDALCTGSWDSSLKIWA
jgi:guanine nucleotide-binding protein G(I)/G(S)/G(T) subunit beta-1